MFLFCLITCMETSHDPKQVVEESVVQDLPPKGLELTLIMLKRAEMMLINRKNGKLLLRSVMIKATFIQFR